MGKSGEFSSFCTFEQNIWVKLFSYGEQHLLLSFVQQQKCDFEVAPPETRYLLRQVAKPKLWTRSGWYLTTAGRRCTLPVTTLHGRQAVKAHGGLSILTRTVSGAACNKHQTTVWSWAFRIRPPHLSVWSTLHIALDLLITALTSSRAYDDWRCRGGSLRM